MLLKFKKNIRLKLLFLILKMKCFSLKNAIIIVSDPRSGSTWLGELFNILPKSIINREPLQAYFGVVPKKFNLGWYPYESIDNPNKELQRFFEKVLTFKMFNKWTTVRVSIKKLFKAKNVITKFTLFNQLLPWFVSHFKNKLKHKPVYLVRHPITTCVSQLKTLHKLQHKEMLEPFDLSSRFNAPKCAYGDRFELHVVYINSLGTKLERHIALWCINNCNLLENNTDDWVTIFYEDFVLEPYKNLKKLFISLGLDFEEQDLKAYNFSRPSKSNYRKNFNANKNKQLAGFLSQLSKKELSRIQNIFNHFNLKHYSAFDAFPIKNN